MTEQEKMEWMLRFADRMAKCNGMVNICMMGNQQNIYQTDSAKEAGVGENTGMVLPPELDTQDMRSLLDRLVEAGVLMDNYQLKEQTWTEKSVIVAFLSGKLGKRCMWAAFAKLWGCDKNALQAAYTKHCDTAAARAYYQKLTEILG